MSRAVLPLHRMADKAKAIQWVDKAPWGTRLTFQGPTRSNDQNALMWSALTDIATQTLYHGQRLSPEDFKLLFMAALNQEMRLVPNLEGNGFVPLGRSSSKLSKAEFSELIELIFAWGARNNIVFHDQPEDSPAARDATEPNKPVAVGA